jgi:hypothetical protein
MTWRAVSSRPYGEEKGTPKHAAHDGEHHPGVEQVVQGDRGVAAQLEIESKF